MSEQFIVSARKYRPVSFDSLVGQDAISHTLKRAVAQKKTAHAYLFCGPRGVGKTSAARIFAKAINCQSPSADGDACGICESCKAFQEQRSLNIYELDAASNNSTDDIRRLIEEVSVPPQFGKYKIYIIDEVHMLSSGAFNAFLKTLEEPPSYVIFILATTEKHKILPTILSRCQVFDFKLISSEKIVEQLAMIANEENIDYDEEALQLIAKKADGGMRDALSLFDRIASFGQGAVSLQQTVDSLHILDEDYFVQFCSLIKSDDASAILSLLDRLIDKGFDAKEILVGMQEFLRKLMLAIDMGTISIAQLTPKQQEEYSRLALDLGKSFIYRAILRLTEAEKNYRMSNAKRLLVEMAFLGLTSLSATSTINDKQPIQATKAVHQANSPRLSSTGNTSLAHLDEQNKRSFPPDATTKSNTSHRVNVSIPRPLAIKKKSNAETIDTTTNKEPVQQEKQEIITSSESVIAPATLSQSILEEEWKRMAESLPHSTRIKSLIENREIIYQGDNSFVINVVTDEQEHEIKQLLPDLIERLKRNLTITDLTATTSRINIAERNKGLSNEEWLLKKKTENPQVKQLMDDLNLRPI